MIKSFIWGNNELARVMASYLEEEPPERENIIGLTADEGYLESPIWYKGKVIPFNKSSLEQAAEDYRGDIGIYLPISYKNMNKLREEKFNQAKEMGLIPRSFISSKAVISKFTQLGKANLIFELANIQTGCQLGDNNLIWGGGVHIGHGSQVGSHNFITTGTVISGNCKIGNNCFFGVNSCIKDNIEIPDGTLVGMGAVITKTPKEPYQVFLAGVNNLYMKSSLDV